MATHLQGGGWTLPRLRHRSETDSQRAAWGSWRLRCPWPERSGDQHYWGVQILSDSNSVVSRSIKSRYLELVKAQKTRLLTNLLGNRSDGVVGFGHFSCFPLRHALFQSMDPWKQRRRSVLCSPTAVNASVSHEHEANSRLCTSNMKPWKWTLFFFSVSTCE